MFMTPSNENRFNNLFKSLLFNNDFKSLIIYLYGKYYDYLIYNNPSYSGFWNIYV